MSEEKAIVFYDGDCGLCDMSVKTLLDIDHDDFLMYSPLQSEFAASKLDPRHIEELDTLVVLYKGKTYVRGGAVKLFIRSLKSLLLWKWVLIIPTPIVDFGYSIVSRYRYLVFGKNDNCLYLDEKLKEKFILN